MEAGEKLFWADLAVATGQRSKTPLPGQASTLEKGKPLFLYFCPELLFAMIKEELSSWLINAMGRFVHCLKCVAINWYESVTIDMNIELMIWGTDTELW